MKRRRPSARANARRLARFRYDVLHAVHGALQLARRLADEVDDQDLWDVCDRLDQLAHHEAEKFLKLPRQRP